MKKYKSLISPSIPYHISDFKYLPKTNIQLFVFILILFNSQILSGTGGNPFGIKGVQEILYVVLLIFSILYIFQRLTTESRVFMTDALVLGLVISGLIYSALSSNLHFGQPILYGLFEERRILAFLIYFPVIWALRHSSITVQQLLSWIVISAIICSFLSIMVYIGLVPPIKVKEVSPLLLREERYGIGQFYIAFSVLIVASRISLSELISNFFLLILFLGVLIVIVQTRQILIALLIGLFILRGPLRFILWSTLPILLAIFTYTYIQPATVFLDKYITLATQIFSDDYISESARSLTIKTIEQEFLNGAWFGSGALSPLWQGGFPKIYHSNFYLADVGVFGSLYKFGLLAIPFYITYLLLQGNLIRNIYHHKYAKLITSTWVLLLVALPVAASIEYRGFLSGLLIALSIGCLLELKNN